MYKSKELRWFTQHENDTIKTWFAKHGLSFETTQARTDHYLVALINDDTIPKIREGRIEIKHRIGKSDVYNLIPNAEGYFEEFIKWSFVLDKEDALSQEIINARKYASQWTEVYKERMGVKLSEAPDKTVKVFPVSDILESGCQIEYTRIKLKETVWYSFNLEWFGKEFLELDSSIFFEILGETVFRLKDSLNYGKLLKMMIG